VLHRLERAINDLFGLEAVGASDTRPWLRERHPRLAASLALTERDPIVARVWARHFD